jgi:predicted transposase YdaD
LSLTKELYRRGFSKSDILKLYHFIDWLMMLPEALEQTCYQEIVQFEEEQKMPYITTAERIGQEKGREEGRQEGIQKGTLIGEILLAQRILHLTVYSQEELEQKALDELKRLVEKFEAKLTRADDQKEENPGEETGQDQ